MNDSQFVAEHFLQLNGQKLIEYAETFISLEVDRVPQSEVDLLVKMLEELSNEQAVYALEICARANPAETIGPAIKFLTHSDSAVCSAAFRAVERISQNMTISQVHVKEILNSPVVDLYSVHVRTGERTKIGTNAEFLRTLASRYKGETGIRKLPE